jgi:hypothetical protein
MRGLWDQGKPVQLAISELLVPDVNPECFFIQPTVETK